MLHNYGGDELKVVRQLMATISREGHTYTATVLVQKGAPLGLLLGTNLQTQLGFIFLQKKTDGTAVDLLQKRKWPLSRQIMDQRRNQCHRLAARITREDNPLDATAKSAH